MKKLLILILASAMMTCMVSCSKPENELYAFYTNDDNVVNTDIGEYIMGRTSDFFTEGKFCYVKPEEQSTDENLSVKACIMINLTENKLVFADRIFDKVYPASITKLLTALIILRHANLDDIYVVKQDNCGITEEGAQLMGFKAGDKISVKNLLYCLLLYSGNDAAAALADYYSNDIPTFCNLMNEEAERLGCIGTHYTNPHGLHDDNHYTTAYDEYVILRYCLDYDLFRDIAQSTEYEFSYEDAAGQIKTMSVVTTNKFKLGQYEMPQGMSIIGGKTGNTFAAGPCLIQSVSNADGEEFIIGIFGGGNNDKLYRQMQYMMNKAAGEENMLPDPLAEIKEG